MLFHANLTVDPLTATYSCLLYASPYFCDTVFPDSKSIMNEKEGDLWNEKINKKLTPPIKRQDIDIVAALASDEMIQLNLQDDSKQL